MTFTFTDPATFFIHHPPNWGAVIVLDHYCQDNMPFSMVVIHSIVKSAAEMFTMIEVGNNRMRLTAFGDN